MRDNGLQLLLSGIACYILGFVTREFFSSHSEPLNRHCNGTSRSRRYKMVLVVNNSLKMGKGKIGEALHEIFSRCTEPRGAFI